MRLARIAGPLLVALALTLGAPPARADGPASGAWNFRVLLDGKLIGTHRFTLKTEGEQRLLKSLATFEVKVLGLTAYRYRHEADKQWQGNCLAALSSKTDDDGRPLMVRARRDGDELTVDANQIKDQLEGCVMSFAYWNPAMQKATRLLNAQTGKIEPLGDDTVESQGKTVDAKRWHITGLESPLDVWYSRRATGSRWSRRWRAASARWSTGASSAPADIQARAGRPGHRNGRIGSLR